MIQSFLTVYFNEYAVALIRSDSTGPLRIRGKSMGCMAFEVFSAKPVILGVIDNISIGGLTFPYVKNKIQLNNSLMLDILLPCRRLYLEDFAFKVISDVEIPEDRPGDPIKMRQLRLQFQNFRAGH